VGNWPRSFPSLRAVLFECVAVRDPLLRQLMDHEGGYVGERRRVKLGTVKVEFDFRSADPREWTVSEISPVPRLVVGPGFVGHCKRTVTDRAHRNVGSRTSIPARQGTLLSGRVLVPERKAFEAWAESHGWTQQEALRRALLSAMAGTSPLDVELPITGAGGAT
jgi:hypothetical protein